MKLFHSATLKLTAWYTLIIMAISAFFSVSMFQLSHRHFLVQAERETTLLRGFGFRPGFFPTSLLQVRQNLLDEFRQRAITELVFFNAGIFLLAGVGSYWYARRTLRPLEEAMESQRRFTADASHELRTPLTAMKTEIEVALRRTELPGNDMRRLLQSGLEEIETLTNLSDGLLRLARYEETSSPLPLEPVSLATVAEAAERRVQPLAQEGKIHLALRSFEYVVRGNGDALTELFVILLDNAIKYSPAGSTVEAGASRAGRTVSVFVRDHGSGIAAEDLPRIFDRFFRTDRSRSKKTVSGYGLGLAIAKAIVERHHGTITATSAPERGTTFVVTLKSPSEGIGMNLRRSFGS